MNIKKAWLLICLYSQITNIPQEAVGFACELSPRLHQKSVFFKAHLQVNCMLYAIY